MKRSLLIIFALVALIVGIVIGYKIADRNPEKLIETQKEITKTETFKDPKSGLELSLPASYKTVNFISAPTSLDNSKSSVVMQLEQSTPQSFVIVQHDKGLSGPATLLRQSVIEYVETTISQYYPTRYGSSYKSESLERTKVNGHDAVEHVYAYTDKDGKPNKVKLLVVVWSGDETYNIILQSSEANFETIKDDLNSVKMTFKVNE